MLSFENDYNCGAHSEILKRLIETNNETLSGYGTDKYCLCAKEKIKAACENSDAEVFLLVGGTQTNQLIISSMLNSCEAVISADTGHINTHEAGAIEYTGHKVLTLAHKNGKLEPNYLKTYLDGFYADENNSHAPQPAMVYISQPTEYGTLYTKAELEKISQICKEHELVLFLDGARLGYALESEGNDLELRDIAKLCDVFYIGGTKVGALCGEAVVFTHKNAPKYFFTQIKQHGALLAKGRLLGISFDTLFTDNLYFKISRHAICMANKLREIFANKGYKFYIETTTNQIFIELDNQKLKELSNKVTFCFWESIDQDHTVVRFATSWATKQEDIDKLKEIL